MKPLIQYILTTLLCAAVFSCSNSFLKDDFDLSTTADSGIYLSPQWEAADYPIQVPMAVNAKFSITKHPDWLKVNTPSGQFNDGVAIINCSASVRNDCSATGIYNASMTLNIEHIGTCLVPVSYISEGNPAIQVDPNITLQYGYYSSYNDVNLDISNSGDGILLWKITEKPDWLTINFQGRTTLPNNTLYPLPQYGTVSLDISYQSDSIPTSEMQGKIVITSNDKTHNKIVVNVSFNLGTPSFYFELYDTGINFGRTQTSIDESFSNYGDGLLTWKIDSIPAWLNVSKTSGTLSPYDWENLTFTCNRSLMPNGTISQTIYFKTNDPNSPSYPITVTVTNYTADPNNVKAITGTVTDAWVDKTANILYLATSQPDRLLAYNMKTRSFDKELALSKAPTCFSISEDGHQAVVGHGGLISIVNLDNFSVSKTLDADIIIHSINWGTGNWFCYINPDVSGNYYLRWQNLDTEETYYTINDYYNGSLDDQMLLKKIPHQDYIIASSYKTDVFSTQTRDYVREYYYLMDNFWFSSDGNYIFTANNLIYKTSTILTSSDYVPPIGSFSPYLDQIYWIDHNAATHSIWILSTSYDDYSYYDGPQQEIRQYEDNDYTFVKKYNFDELYNGSPAQAQYVFTNDAGNEVLVIKNNSWNAWAIEYVPIKN